MASPLYYKRAHASVEYEGTTLTRKGKSMQAGGEWDIVPGGEFGPLVVGRQIAPECEDPALTIARTHSGFCPGQWQGLTSGEISESTHRAKPGRSFEIKQKTLLGPTISEGLNAMSPAAARRGSSAKYLLSYTSSSGSIQK